MYKKLRRNFILLTMSAVILVISIIMVAINIFNFNEVKKYSDGLLDTIVYDRDFFEREKEDNPPPMEPQEGGFFDPTFRRSMETPFETRYFTVDFGGDHQFINLDHIASVDIDTAVEYAEEAINSGKKIGYIDNFRYKVVEKDGGGVKVAFVDCSRQIISAESFLKISIVVSLAAILVVFIGIFFISKRVVAPIVKSYERQKQFITDASHELKTPLTIISANNELVEMEYGENQSTRAINKQVVRMNSLVKNMSMLSKIDEASRLEKKEFSLTDALVDNIEAFKPSIEGKDLELDIKDDVKVFSDENLIRQMIAILLDNARKYSLTRIKIELQKTQKACLVITNDCSNISEVDLKKVFDRFYRDSAARALKEDGSGIGLAIAKEIVTLHGGEIVAQNDNGDFLIKVIL